MITITNTNSYYSNQLKFGKKENEESQENNKKSISDNVTRPLKTGLLVTSAFLAGMGVSNIPTDNSNEKTEIYQEYSGNRPPSNEIRDWYVDKELSSNGKTYNTREHYRIQEIPFLVATEVRDKTTNQLVQKDTLYDYRSYPDIKESYMSDGKLGASRKFYNFSDEYFAPERAQFKTLLNDGSYDIVDVKYNIETKRTNTKPTPKPQPKNNTINDISKELYDAFFGE